MYHFFSPRSCGVAAAAASPCEPSLPLSALLGSPELLPPAFSATLAIDQLREVRPDEGEQAEDDSRDDRHDDHDEGRRANLLGGRPRDLLELAGHLVRELIHLIVTVERNANDHGSDPRDQRDLRFARSG